MNAPIDLNLVRAFTQGGLAGRDMEAEVETANLFHRRMPDDDSTDFHVVAWDDDVLIDEKGQRYLVYEATQRASA